MTLEGRRYHAGDLPGRLLREAREMLETGGLKQLNLRALAARAGITAGSMYHHYDSKRALLAELAVLGFGELRRSLEQSDRDAGDGGRLRAWATSYFVYARQEPAMFALMFDADLAGLPAVADARETALGVLRRIVGEVAGAQGRSEAPREQIALAVWAAAHGAASLATTGAGGTGLIDDVIAGLESLFRPAAT